MRRRGPDSTTYFFWARLAGIPAVVFLVAGGAVHGGLDLFVQVSWALMLLVLGFTVAGILRRRGEPRPEPMRPYAVYLAVPASVLALWAGWTDSHNGIVFASSFVLIVRAFLRSVIELLVGRLTRDWRTWLGLALSLSYCWNINYALCLSDNSSRFDNTQCPK